MLLARYGDAVLLPAPWYFNYEMTLGVLGVEPRALPCLAENAFVPHPADAEPLIDNRVRAMSYSRRTTRPVRSTRPAFIEQFAELCMSKAFARDRTRPIVTFSRLSLNRPHEHFTGQAWRDHVVGL
jgi:hypothetical protein